jgi:transcription antitermination protein NusB
MVYLNGMESLLLENEWALIGIISLIAPRFDLETIPTIHILILMLSLTEMIYWKGEEIPASVSVNEAIELTKKFSDDQGKGFINGALATFMKEREVLLLKAIDGTFRIFKTV